MINMVTRSSSVGIGVAAICRVQDCAALLNSAILAPVSGTYEARR